jgi:hypothetical protein
MADISDWKPVVSPDQAAEFSPEHVEEAVTILTGEALLAKATAEMLEPAEKNPLPDLPVSLLQIPEGVATFVDKEVREEIHKTLRLAERLPYAKPAVHPDHLDPIERAEALKDMLRQTGASEAAIESILSRMFKTIAASINDLRKAVERDGKTVDRILGKTETGKEIAGVYKAVLETIEAEIVGANSIATKLYSGSVPMQREEYRKLAGLGEKNNTH